MFGILPNIGENRYLSQRKLSLHLDISKTTTRFQPPFHENDAHATGCKPIKMFVKTAIFTIAQNIYIFLGH